jgi:hypothetical protein
LVMGSRLLSSEWSVTAGAFIVTNPTDESNSSRLAVIWKQFGG